MYFAEIKNGIVERVIVADSKEWCVEHLGGEWVETFIDKDGHNYAGLGDTYDSGNFIAPKPFKTWNLDEKQTWVAPVSKQPDDFSWDDKNGKWLKYQDNLTKT